MRLSLFEKGAFDRQPISLELSLDCLSIMLSAPCNRLSVPYWRKRRYAEYRAWIKRYADLGQPELPAISDYESETGLEKLAELAQPFGVPLKQARWLHKCLKTWPNAFTRKDMLKQEKLRVPCWSPVSYRPGERRLKANVVEIGALVLDFDSGCSFEDATAPWMDWHWLLHTSWSHSEDHPKFRLVLPLSEPVPASEWGRVYAWAEAFGGGEMDTVTKDASRLFFLPARASGRTPFEFVEHASERLLRIEMEDLPPKPVRKARPPRQSRTLPYVAADRLRRSRLRRDPQTREAAAAELGARVSGQRAYGVLCPSCSRKDVYFFIDPTKRQRAHCNHAKSCGWTGHLFELLGAA